MNITIENFIETGFTTESMVPKEHVKLFNYHPAVNGKGTFQTHGLETKIDSNGVLKLIPLFNEGHSWEAKHIQLFSNLKLKFNGEYFTHQFENNETVIDEIGDYKLTDFCLKLDRFEGGKRFTAELEWEFHGKSVNTKWFWIPPM